MTHFRSDCHLDRHSGMNGELRDSRTPTGKRGSGVLDRSVREMEYVRHPDDHCSRVFDYQRVPCSVPVNPTPAKRPRPSSSSSSSSSSTAAQRMKHSRASSKSKNTHTTTSSKLKMAELLAIKRELTVIKVQLDGLLDCVNRMDRQRTHCSECPPSREPSESDSPHRVSVSSLERESPEPGEASEDETLHYQHYYPHSCPHRCPISILRGTQKRDLSTQLQQIMAATESSPLSTHVLNTGDGVPAARMALSLHRLDSNLIWNLLSVGTTDEDGRCPRLISRESFSPGMYKLRFETGSYWESLGQSCFYPYVEVVFTISDQDQKLHLPLLMSRFSYSTYRGS
ncbi:5-hydroxyisourate hydrolase [Channa argus]|uniref:5-hydroxyisourate hydrolase n=2 Tax=Channa argus TaxID=215402 RepID=A0A6G1QTN9_CHAAH|nr:5-hydroxyisourate hydrolase [Channa argus]